MKGPPFIFLWGERGSFFFQVGVWCGEWTVHFPLGQCTVHFSCKLFVCLFVCFVLFCFVSPLGWGRVKAKSPQVPDLFLKMFPLAAPHFYPICFGKCCPPFIYIDGLKGRIAYFIIEPSM
jgi:hypothetical protein